MFSKCLHCRSKVKYSKISTRSLLPALVPSLKLFQSALHGRQFMAMIAEHMQPALLQQFYDNLPKAPSWQRLSAPPTKVTAKFCQIHTFTIMCKQRGDTHVYFSTCLCQNDSGSHYTLFWGYLANADFEPFFSALIWCIHDEKGLEIRWISQALQYM